MADKLKLNMVSESVFTVQGHGVHTAFLENTNALKKRKDITVRINADWPTADVTHVQTVGPYSMNKLLRARGAKVISAHVTPDSFVGSLVGAKFWYGAARAYLRWFYNRADVLLAVSHEVADEVKKLGVTKKIVVVPNTIDTAKVTRGAKKAHEKWRKKLKIDKNSFVVISVGQIQPRKRIDTFVGTAKKIPEATFVWVGGIPFKHLAADYEEMKKIQENPPPNVRFTGIIENLSHVYELYGISNAFFLPSDQETFGIVIVEAAAAGLPVVLRDNDQYRQTFGPENYLHGQDKDFTRLIKRLSSDKDLYLKMQRKSAKIASMYDSVRGAQLLIDAYKLAIKINRNK